MTVTMEIDAPQYMTMCWGGAQYTVEHMSTEQIQTVLDYLDDLDDFSLTQLNDLFWFEPDYIAMILGFDSFEELEEFNK